VNNDCTEVIITADDPDWLAEFTQRLVEDRLVACGQSIATVRSICRWENAVQDVREARVALHTRASLVPAIVDRTNADHPYDVPCVIALPITQGNPEYLSWILESTREA